ncbi:hypothetical protein Mapa_001289 [Marchantia paleacea]|nr:hypothetical protein Mapa_001289 [Marchantia paleacea]
MEEMMVDQENVGPLKRGPKPKAGAKGLSKAAAAPKPLQSSSGANVEAGRHGKTIEEMYQKKTQLEHILLRPDTYVGSIEKHKQSLWVYEGGKMVHREVSYVPGLYKIFDEILVNAADNKQRDPTMDSVKVEINVAENTISVFNNGAGVPVEIHAEEGVYVPEMIFGHLLTSSNYDDSEKKTTGGRNGYGAKLANIFSTEFTIETADGNRLRRYKQVFQNNMGVKGEPSITKCKASESWTKVTFKPDLPKFNMSYLEEDVVALMSKRVLDIAGCLGKTVKVELNGQRLPIKSFSDYVSMYLSAAAANAGRDEPLPKLYEKVNDRWEIVVTLSDGQFQQVSFVNSIATIKGGSHVTYVSDQVVNNLLTIVNKKNKTASVKPFQIKSHIWIFVNALIDNPAFDSQTKETLTTRQSSFGSKCELSPEFLKKVAKCGIVENVLTWAEFKQSKDLKKTDGAKRQRITGIIKLDDANDAGGRNSQECTLILTEGDSAKALAMAGISVVGRNKYGCFPLRGKLLNVREASKHQVMENAEINNIKQILGLQHGKDYDSTKSLRYGHLMIMTDQDHDGSHIKGLLINFIHSFWPSLLKLPNFLLEFITPIVKATHKNGKVLSFYSMPEYESWKESVADEAKKWTIKYYKGLGTSTSKEGKEYFMDLGRHKKDFTWQSEKDGDAIEMAFSKKKVDARKTWLRHYEPGTFLDQSAEVINYEDFVNKELIQFSIADLARSIPSMVDGLKPGQRKILYCSFKRNFVKQAKVSQFSGYVSEHSAYHHGEASLASTIINMAQTYVGSNNINLLAPLGQFGTRNQGGKDHASSRYVFTCLSPITRKLFPQPDDMLLDYLKEDGQSIEPKWYAPIIPMVLVNGSEGIGTGWSTYVPNYNPRDIVANIMHLLKNEPMIPMDPWYKGFRGTIERSAVKENGVTYTCTGIIDQINETTLKVTELPVKKWTQDYKEYLESLMVGSAKVKEPFIKDYREHGTDTAVDFEVQLSEENMNIALLEGLTKKFNLTTKISTGNMHLFDANGMIKKYDTPEQILEEFFHIRLDLYVKRKAVQLSNLEEELSKLANKVRFILGVVKGEIVVSNRKRADLLEELRIKKFRPFPKNGRKDEPPVAGTETVEGEDTSEQEEPRKEDVRIGDYEYLLAMAIGQLTFEKVELLLSQKEEFEGQVDALRKASPEDLWARDLEAFLTQLDANEAEEAKDAEYERKVMANEGSKIVRRAGASKAAKKPPQPRKTTATTAAVAVEEGSEDAVPKKKAAGRPGAAKAGAKKAPATKPVVLDDSDEEDLGLNLSLTDRMAAMKLRGTSPVSEGSVAAPKTAAAAAFMDLSDEEEDAVEEEAPPPPKAAPKATTKRVTKQRIVDSDSEDDVIALESDSDFEAEEISPPKGRKKAAPKKAPAAKKAPAPKKAATAASSDTAVPKKRGPKPKAKGDAGAAEAASSSSPYKQSPQLKVQKLRISPFHKKSGPLENHVDLPRSLEDFGEDEMTVAPAAARPRRATRPVAKYVDAFASESEGGDSSEFDEEDEM